MKKKKYEQIKLLRLDLEGLQHEEECPINPQLVSDQFIGCVVEVHRAGVYVVPVLEGRNLDFSRMWFCQIRGLFFETHKTVHAVLVVGDKVLVQDLPDPTQRTGRILKVFRRDTMLFRESTLKSHRLQLMFANVDVVLGVFAWRQPQFRVMDVDRFLIWTAQSQVRPALIFTKSDLRESSEHKIPRDCLAFYDQYLENRLFNLSIFEKDRADWRRLQSFLNGKICAVYGESGVGKSSLINQLQDEHELLVDERADLNHRKRYRYGRHTTTYSTLIPLSQGGIVDSPGWRSFRLPFLTWRDLRKHYTELEGRGCRFRGCWHDGEDGCMIPQLVEKGFIASWRYQNYLTFKRTSYED